MNHWFFRVYLGYRNKILLGYKIEDFREFESGTSDPLNIFIYLPFIELFLQWTPYNTPFWGGIEV